MKYITSTSTNGGLSTIVITFEIGRDPDLAAVDVQNRVQQAIGRLPNSVASRALGFKDEGQGAVPYPSSTSLSRRR